MFLPVSVPWIQNLLTRSLNFSCICRARSDRLSGSSLPAEPEPGSLPQWGHFEPVEVKSRDEIGLFKRESFLNRQWLLGPLNAPESRASTTIQFIFWVRRQEKLKWPDSWKEDQWQLELNQLPLACEATLLILDSCKALPVGSYTDQVMCSILILILAVSSWFRNFESCFTNSLMGV